MAIAATHLAQNTTSGTSPASSSVTPTANRLILVAIAVYSAGANPTVNSVTGNGITYSLVASATAIDDGFGPYRIHLYRGMSASPSAGAITASLSANGDQVDFSISEFSGVDTSGTNGSGAIVQSNTAVVNEQTSLTITLSAFGSVDNGAYGCLVSYDDVPITPGSGWTELDDVTQIQTQWRATNDTSVDWSWSGARDCGAIAVEIKADAGGSSPQTINPSAIAAGSQLYGPSFTFGAVTVSPGAIASGSQLYAPSLGGAATVSPDAIASGSTVHAPSLSSSVTVSPGLLTDSETVHAPTVTPGAVTVSPALLALGPNVYTPSITGGEEPEPSGKTWVPTTPDIANEDIGRKVL